MVFERCLSARAKFYSEQLISLCLKLVTKAVSNDLRDGWGWGRLVPYLRSNLMLSYKSLNKSNVNFDGFNQNVVWKISVSNLLIDDNRFLISLVTWSCQNMSVPYLPGRQMATTWLGRQIVITGCKHVCHWILICRQKVTFYWAVFDNSARIWTQQAGSCYS